MSEFDHDHFPQEENSNLKLSEATETTRRQSSSFIVIAIFGVAVTLGLIAHVWCYNATLRQPQNELDQEDTTLAETAILPLTQEDMTDTSDVVADQQNQNVREKSATNEAMFNYGRYRGANTAAKLLNDAFTNADGWENEGCAGTDGWKLKPDSFYFHTNATLTKNARCWLKKVDASTINNSFNALIQKLQTLGFEQDAERTPFVYYRSDGDTYEFWHFDHKQGHDEEYLVYMRDGDEIGITHYDFLINMHAEEANVEMPWLAVLQKTGGKVDIFAQEYYPFAGLLHYNNVLTTDSDWRLWEAGILPSVDGSKWNAYHIVYITKTDGTVKTLFKLFFEDRGSCEELVNQEVDPEWQAIVKANFCASIANN